MVRGTELVIFDCDGVLVDSEPLAAEVLARELNAIGYAITAEDCIERFTGISMPATVAAIEADWGRPLPEGFEAWVRAADFAAFARELTPIAGVADAVGRLACRVCVASSGAPEKMCFSLQRTGLLPLFAPHLFSAGMVAHGKPAPDLFLYAARAMGADPGACVVVEDAVPGVLAAVAAGMRALGFIGGGHCRPATAAALTAAGAQAVFAEMQALPGLVADHAASNAAHWNR